MSYSLSQSTNKSGPGIDRSWLWALFVGLVLAGGLILWNVLFQKKQPNVLLISIDTVRADRMGCYGGPAGVSPEMDRLASEGYLFEYCMAPSSWTLPSVMSLHTGLYPFTHGVEWVDRKLDKFRPTLAQLFKEKGYQTGGIQSSLFLQGYIGFDRGFDHYGERPIHGHLDVSSKNLTDRSLGWLNDRDPDRPFFFWVHYLDPHYDYLRQPEAARFIESISEELVKRPYSIMNLKKELYSLEPEEYEAINQLYHGEILHTDGHLGRLIDFLEQEEIDDETWVVVTADHGEMMGEHGMLGHTESFYQPVLHVPLIIRPPGGLPQPVRNREQVVSLIDIAPTLLQAAGIGFEAGQFEGRPLLEESGGKLKQPEKNNSRWASSRTDDVDFVVQWEGGLKFIRDYQNEQNLVFDLSSDPQEKINARVDQRSRWEIFQNVVEELEQLRRRTGDMIPVDPELEQQMKSQGYAN